MSSKTTCYQLLIKANEINHKFMENIIRRRDKLYLIMCLSYIILIYDLY